MRRVARRALDLLHRQAALSELGVDDQALLDFISPPNSILCIWVVPVVHARAHDKSGFWHGINQYHATPRQPQAHCTNVQEIIRVFFKSLFLDLFNFLFLSLTDFFSDLFRQMYFGFQFYS